jgi:hypothetical protein
MSRVPHTKGPVGLLNDPRTGGSQTVWTAGHGRRQDLSLTGPFHRGDCNRGSSTTMGWTLERRYSNLSTGNFRDRDALLALKAGMRRQVRSPEGSLS